MEELSTSVPRDRSGSVAFSSCRISLVTLVLAAAAAALITLLFWYMLVWPRSWTCACLLRLSWSVPRVAYNEVVSCDAGHNLWKLLTGSVWFCLFNTNCLSFLFLKETEKRVARFLFLFWFTNGPVLFQNGPYFSIFGLIKLKNLT